MILPTPQPISTIVSRRRDPDVEELQHLVERLPATGPEALKVGVPITELVVDEVERILAGAGIPEPLHRCSIHSDRS